MQWDVFISHASEDKDIARNLAYRLEDSGLQVWFDSFQLNTGDSLRGKIDEGLAASEYGVVILSQAFFAKKWPQRELNGLLSREEEGRKIILPVWHGITASDIRKYSPILADKLAPSTAEGISTVTQSILSAIFKEQISASGWGHEELLWPDMTSMIVVPTQPVDGLSILIGKTPITNQQYKKFVERVGCEEPCGKVYVDGQWQEDFYPWRDTSFSNPMQPVVCVSHQDARNYCRYINSQIRASNEINDMAATILPTSKLWEFAAYRSLQSSDDVSSAGIDNTSWLNS
jgi:TIR domain/Sulfatase-modifying factor enzyme 1